MKIFGTDENIKIDLVHAELVKSLVISSKPEKVLELGIGGGRSTDAIIQAIEYNNNKCSFTVVDNWLDFGGIMPQEVQQKYGLKINIVSSDEKKYIFSCNEKYDFIMSDADHHHTNEWFEYVYDNILNNNGILIYHDVDNVTNVYPNLVDIYKKCNEKKISHYLFNKSSLDTERCHRGLLVIFKTL